MYVCTQQQMLNFSFFVIKLIFKHNTLKTYFLPSCGMCSGIRVISTEKKKKKRIKATQIFSFKRLIELEDV